MYNKGLTLVELMVTLAVLAILLAIAAPRFSTISTGNKLTAKINSLSGDLAYARNEAVTRNANVTLAAMPGGWADGWRVFVDADTTDGNYISGTDTLLKSGQRITSNLTITNSGGTSITFKSDGAKSTTGTFALKLCDNSRAAGNHGKEVSVIVSGQRSMDSKAVCP